MIVKLNRKEPNVAVEYIRWSGTPERAMLHPSWRTRPLCPPLHEQLAPGPNLAPANPPLRHSRSDSCPDWWTELEEVGQQTCSEEEVEQDSHANISSAGHQQTDDECLHGVGTPRGLQQLRCSLAEALRVSGTELRQIISQNLLKYILPVQILSQKSPNSAWEPISVKQDLHHFYTVYTE